MSGVFKFPDAGDIKSYDKQGNLINPEPGDELYGQNGCFVINPMSFTKLGDKGKKLPDSAKWDDGYRMVLDNNTGLVWEVKSPVAGDVNFCEDRYSWPDAQEVYIRKLNEIIEIL